MEEIIPGAASDDFREDSSSGGAGLPVMSMEGPGVSGETTGLIVFSLYSPGDAVPTDETADPK